MGGMGWDGRLQHPSANAGALLPSGPYGQHLPSAVSCGLGWAYLSLSLCVCVCSCMCTPYLCVCVCASLSHIQRSYVTLAPHSNISNIQMNNLITHVSDASPFPH
ncbi:hypothetical protein LX32DRAFT_347675 [Colletotrichum zoysiae]|uniref:Uncharacterized protein n=1 Tax=Colletotrichum zoysiae TaxID=1216348 RepID=A0AAD9HJ07_9PEZI|nr:hypothetical protein LX32DRAFT_347675 [Colletotrichum zoysiae]